MATNDMGTFCGVSKQFRNYGQSRRKVPTYLKSISSRWHAGSANGGDLRLGTKCRIRLLLPRFSLRQHLKLLNRIAILEARKDKESRTSAVVSERDKPQATPSRTHTYHVVHVTGRHGQAKFSWCSGGGLALGSESTVLQTTTLE